MPTWDQYPQDYRSSEVQTLLRTVRAGDSAAVIGLSGSGKSNVMGFLANRVVMPGVHLLLVDCNRVDNTRPETLYAAIRRVLGCAESSGDEAYQLETCLDHYFQTHQGNLTILLDRFDLFVAPRQDALYNHLRAVRDAFKYQLSYVISSRLPFPLDTELSELFTGCTLWLGPLSEADARWSIARYADRRGIEFSEAQVQTLLALSGGYPSFLRAACEAMAAGAGGEAALIDHPAVRMRLEEFWDDQPSDEALRLSCLQMIPLVRATRPLKIDTDRLTAKELLLLETLQAHKSQVCEKDDLIRAVWPEDRVFLQGVRDDSLAQLVKRLRSKIEPDPANPRYILTVTGRGYEYRG
jgi:hypothetical protein